jgi:hypothetical protein
MQKIRDPREHLDSLAAPGGVEHEDDQTLTRQAVSSKVPSGW